MDTLDKYRQIIENFLTEYAAIPYAYCDLKSQVIISRDLNHFILMTLGWEDDGTQVHGCVLHLEIINGKIWIHRDGLEDGIANELVAAGIPKDQIVLGFHSEDVRVYTDFAVN
jgi:hypothetical protein